MIFAIGQDDYFGPYNQAVYNEYERLIDDYESRSGKPASDTVKQYLKQTALDSMRPDGSGYTPPLKNTIIADPVFIKGSQPGKWTPVFIGIAIAGILAWSQLK